MKRYVKPIIEIVELRTEERLAGCTLVAATQGTNINGHYTRGCNPPFYSGSTGDS
jgi:hypothetical protein